MTDYNSSSSYLLCVFKSCNIAKILAGTALFVSLAAQTFASDWPMLRYDASRSAASPHGVTKNPKLQWSRKLPPTQPAWRTGRDSRDKFDESYEPVVMGKSLIVASPNTGAITAYDTDLGIEKWRFYTNGPVRCAPACWRGKVYAGSDDGYLYCLNAKTGKLLWKFRGAPKEYPERRILGNEHLISFWPVRGGPVIKDGTLCFGAGIWPIFGIFIYALDAETGKVKWCQKDLNYLENVRCDHDKLIESGLSPQGSFVAVNDKLIVPCGRSMPAGLDFKTGKLVYYTLGYYGGGDSHVAACDNFVFVGKAAVLNSHDFRELGSKWAYRGNQPPEDYAKWAKIHIHRIPKDLFECPFLPYNKTKICNAYSAYDSSVSYCQRQGVFRAYNLKKTKRFEEKINWQKKVIYPVYWDAELIWELKVPGAGPSSNLVIKAGDRIYSYAKRKLFALENLNGPPKIAWRKEIVGTPSSMLAADEKLFVVTKEGWIHCFGGSGKEKKIYDAKPLPLKSQEGELSPKIAKFLKSTDLKSGYCVVQGIKDGALLAEILKNSKMMLVAIDDDPRKINLLKKRFEKNGFLGKRIELFTGKPFEFELPQYMARLILSEKVLSSEQLNKMNLPEIYNVLRPYGGALCLEMNKETRSDFTKIVKNAKLAKAELKTSGAWTSLIREGALPRSGQWTHNACDTANSLCSKDEIVKAPLGLLWFGDQNGSAQDVHVGKSVSTKVACGRVFTLQQKRPRTLFAYDAYTGLPLWKVGFKSFFTSYVVMEDGIYLATDGQCIVYDPESGKRLKTFDFGDKKSNRVKALKVTENEILILCDAREAHLEKRISGKANDRSWFKSVSNSRTLICLDRKSGAELWRRDAKNKFANSTLIAGDGMLFCAEPDPISEQDLKEKPGFKGTSSIISLDARDGREIWQKRISRADGASLSLEKGVLVAARRKWITALDMKSGKILWEKKCGYDTPIIVNGSKLILQKGNILDAVTGKRLRSIDIWKRMGCSYSIASKNIYLLRCGTANYIDLKRDKNFSLRNIRSGCQNNMIPADGILSAPNYLMVCTCGYAIRTSYAMVHMPETAKWSGENPLKVTPPSALPEMEAKIIRFKRVDPDKK